MKKHSILAAAATALILGLAACDAATDSNETGNAAVAQGEADGLAKLGAINMDVDTSYLSAEEREVVNLLDPGGEPDERDLQAPEHARLRQAPGRGRGEERSEAAGASSTLSMGPGTRSRRARPSSAASPSRPERASTPPI